MLGGFRLRAGLTIFLLGTTGLLEGFALMALIPVLSLAVGSGVTQISPGYVEGVLNYFSIPRDYLLHAGLVIFAILGLLTAVFRFVGEASLLRIRTRVEESARREMSQALLKMNWERYLSMRVGDISKAMLAEAVQMSVAAHLFLQGVAAMFVAVGYLVIAIVISPKMTAFTLLFGLIGVGVYYLSWLGSRRHTRELSKLMTSIGEEVNDIFGNLKFFRATGHTQTADAKAREIYRHYATTYFWSQVFNSVMRFCFESGAVVFIAAFLVVTVIIYGQSVATVLIFLAVFYRLTPRLFTVQENFFQARTYLPWYETWQVRMAEARAATEQHQGEVRLLRFEELRLEGVQLTYAERTMPALREVDLSIGSGRCVAIVGKSGSGKSTIVDVATGLLSPDQGRITVNGIDLKNMDLEFWRSKIGLVLQDSPVFYGTVLQNITWGEDRADEERASRVARLANAWEFIEHLPSGLHSVIGERGGTMSGGQRQRIALARALYRSPWLLILDEATSALDSHSEAAVQDALRSIRGSCAVLMVAHRLKTVQMADRILVLDKGKVVEEGTWVDLLRRQGGAFRQMAELQGVDVRAA